MLSLFSKNIYSNIDNFDSQVDKLINYVTGSYISFKYSLGTGVDILRQNFNQIEFIYNAASELYTTDSKYFLSILYCSQAYPYQSLT